MLLPILNVDHRIAFGMKSDAAHRHVIAAVADRITFYVSRILLILLCSEDAFFFELVYLHTKKPIHARHW